jgi:hypothetical protein
MPAPDIIQSGAVPSESLRSNPPPPGISSRTKRWENSSAPAGGARGSIPKPVGRGDRLGQLYRAPDAQPACGNLVFIVPDAFGAKDFPQNVNPPKAVAHKKRQFMFEVTPQCQLSAHGDAALCMNREGAFPGASLPWTSRVVGIPWYSGVPGGIPGYP